MRTKPATRFSKQIHHTQYGIVNWFYTRGITDMEVIKECMYAFCASNDFDMNKIKKEETVSVWIDNKFHSFAKFSTKYLIENNYTK